MARRRMRRRLGSGMAFLAAGVAAFAAYQWWRWPDVAALATRPPESTAFLGAYRARAAAENLPAPRWRWVPYERISDHLKRAVVVAEDIDFFSHRGFAVDELRAALRARLEEGKPLRGASTITQQLAKNLWLSPSRNPWRKAKEALLTVALERHLGKRRILELYLNVIELGPGIYGAEAAARIYFGKAAADLDADQAAQLAAALPNPSRWHPGSDSRSYRWRVATIARRSGRARWLAAQVASPPTTPSR